MNRLHLWYCGSERWSRIVAGDLVPWVLSRLDADGPVLELGPGPGLTTRLLASRIGTVTAVELDPHLAARLRGATTGGIRVVNGDATALPLATGSFGAVLSFTMLHHLPSPQAQDRLFAEAARVLRPGGVFAGSDSRPSLRFRLYHIADTMTPVDPGGLPARLRAAGFDDMEIAATPRRFHFRARRRG